jgi:plasmid stabilization system protein ParE
VAGAVVLFHRLALREYHAARQWYGRAGASLARAFEAEVGRAVARIANAPDQWPIYRGTFRWVKTRRFPYLLYYHTIDPDHVLILAVAHARRRPGYWTRRSRP